MHGLDIKSLSIEALAAVRDDTNKLLTEKIGGRERELLGEVERIKGLISAKASAGAKAKPKYRLNDQEWSGRGSQPAWVKAHPEGEGRWRI
jgi:DNA-binding protein H-NS